MKNEASNLQLSNFEVTIDSVENYTGIDFFPLLIDSDETIIEKKLCLPCWKC